MLKSIFGMSCCNQIPEARYHASMNSSRAVTSASYHVIDLGIEPSIVTILYTLILYVLLLVVYSYSVLDVRTVILHIACSVIDLPDHSARIST